MNKEKNDRYLELALSAVPENFFRIPLAKLHGEKYADYCRKVNRCIPWPPKAGSGERNRI